MEKINQLQKKIMRRVYYAFAIRIVAHPVTAHALVLFVAGYAFTRLVFVDAVLKNIASIEVGELAPHMLRIVYNADVATLVVIGILVFAALSLPLRLPQYQHITRIQTA